MGANQTKFADNYAEAYYADKKHARQMPRQPAPSAKLLSTTQRADPDVEFVRYSAHKMFHGLKPKTHSVKNFRAKTQVVHPDVPGCVCPATLVSIDHRCGSAVAAASPTFGQPRSSYDSEQTLVDDAAYVKRSNSFIGKLKRSISKLGSKKAKKGKLTKSGSLRKGTLRQASSLQVDVETVPSRRSAASAASVRAAATAARFASATDLPSTRSKAASTASKRVVDLFDEDKELPKPSTPWVADSEVEPTVCPGDANALALRLFGTVDFTAADLCTKVPARVPTSAAAPASAPAPAPTPAPAPAPAPAKAPATAYAAEAPTARNDDDYLHLPKNTKDNFVSRPLTIDQLVKIGERHTPMLAACAAAIAEVNAVDEEAVRTAKRAAANAKLQAAKARATAATATEPEAPVEPKKPVIDSWVYDRDLSGGCDPTDAYLPIPRNFGLRPDQAVEQLTGDYVAASNTTTATTTTTTVRSNTGSVRRKPTAEASEAAIQAARAAFPTTAPRKKSNERLSKAPAAATPAPTSTSTSTSTGSKQPAATVAPAAISDDLLLLQQRWAEIQAIANAPIEQEEPKALMPAPAQKKEKKTKSAPKQPEAAPAQEEEEEEESDRMQQLHDASKKQQQQKKKAANHKRQPSVAPAMIMHPYTPRRSTN